MSKYELCYFSTEPTRFLKMCILLISRKPHDLFCLLMSVNHFQLIAEWTDLTRH